MSSVAAKKPTPPELQRSFRGHRGAVTSVAVIPAPAPLTTARGATKVKSTPHSLIASGGMDGTVMLWSTNPTVRALRFTGHKGPVNDVCFYHTHNHYNPSGVTTSAAAAAGNLIASCSSDSTIRLWIPSVKGDSSVIKAHSASVRGICFSSSAAGNSPSPMLLSYSDDKSCKLWSVMTTKFMTSFLGHTNWVRAAAMSHGGSSSGVHFQDQGSSGGLLCASGGDDKVVHVWDPRACSRGSGATPQASKPGVPSQSTYASAAITHSLYYQHSPITALSFSPTNSNILASGAADGTVQVYDLRMTGEGTTPGKAQAGALLQHYGPGGAKSANTSYHVDAVSSLDFDPVVGSMLLSSSHDGTVKMWDLSEGFLYCTLTAHEGPVNKARFSPRFDLPQSSEYPMCSFATAGQDGKILSWDAVLPVRRSAVDSAEASRQQEAEEMTKLVSPSAPAPTTPSFVRPTTASTLRKARTDQQYAAQREESRPQTASGASPRGQRPSSARPTTADRPSTAPRQALRDVTASQRITTNQAVPAASDKQQHQLRDLPHDECYSVPEEASEGKGSAPAAAAPTSSGGEVQALSKLVESLQNQLTNLQTTSAEETRMLRQTIEQQETVNRQLLAQFEQALGFLVTQHGGVPSELGTPQPTNSEDTPNTTTDEVAVTSE